MYNQQKIFRVFRLLSLLGTGIPKSIRYISSLLDIGERSVYRYIDILQSLGFPVEKDRNGKYFLTGDYINNTLNFTIDETIFLQRLVWTTGENHVLRDSVLRKIYFKSEQSSLADLNIETDRTHKYESIKLAIENKKVVFLHGYGSLNSNSFSKRTVEPFEFGTNFLTVHAFDPQDCINKIFHLDRILKVEVTKKDWDFEMRHVPFKIDLFGFRYDDWEEEIELWLSTKARLLLERDFRISNSIFQDSGKEDLPHILVTTIYSTQPLIRFIIGLSNDILIRRGKRLVYDTFEEQKNILQKLEQHELLC